MNLNSCRVVLVASLFCCHPELWAFPTNQLVAQPFYNPYDRIEFNNLANKAIEDGSVQVLVVLKENIGTDDSPKDGQQLNSQQKRIEKEQNLLLKDIPIRRTNSIKRYRYLPFLALSANESELQRLRASSRVAQIFQDKINYPASLDFSVRKIGADLGWRSGYTGAGQTIAILDNGVDKHHPYLQNKVVAEACFSTRNPDQKATPICRNRRTKDLRPGSATVNCKFQDYACVHGTLLAGIAAGNTLAADLSGSGVAPNANIIAVKADTLIQNKKICAPALSCRVFFDSDILRSLEFIYRKRLSFNISSINASIGGKATREQCRTSPIRQTVRKLRSANISVIAASGNEGFRNRLSSPACVPGVISVGSTNDSDVISSFSNSAAALTLLAPGENIGFIMPGVVPFGYEVVASGTSVSAAFVSGAWAQLKSQRPFANIDEILGALISTGVPSRDPKNINIIKPRIQVGKALGLVP